MDFDDDIESNRNNNNHQRNRHHSHNYKAISHPSSKMNNQKRNNQKHKSRSNNRSKQVTTTTSLLSEEIGCHLSNDKPANNDNSFKYKQENKGGGVTFWGSKNGDISNNNSKIEKEMGPDNDNNIIIIDDLEPINEHENENDVNELKKVAGSPTIQ